MKLAFAATFATFFAATPGVAALAAFDGANVKLEHSGGCRKDSPAGQCCHAGSRPYHCH